MVTFENIGLILNKRSDHIGITTYDTNHWNIPGYTSASWSGTPLHLSAANLTKLVTVFQEIFYKTLYWRGEAVLRKDMVLLIKIIQKYFDLSRYCLGASDCYRWLLDGARSGHWETPSNCSMEPHPAIKPQPGV